MPVGSLKRRVAVLENDSQTRKTLAALLAREGHDVVSVDTAEALRQTMTERPVDAVVLDLDVPDDNGLVVVRDLRSTSVVGIIVLTDRDDPVDRIVALEMGADHYMAKPCDGRELAVRLRNLLWRMGGTPLAAGRSEKGQYRFEDWLFDVPKRVLRSPERGTNTLTRQETAVLQALVNHPGQVMSRDHLMDAVNREWNPTDRTIDVLIGRLRRKIERDPSNPELIVTIYGEGYLFTGEVLRT